MLRDKLSRVAFFIVLLPFAMAFFSILYMFYITVGWFLGVSVTIWLLALCFVIPTHGRPPM